MGGALGGEFGLLRKLLALAGGLLLAVLLAIVAVLAVFARAEDAAQAVPPVEGGLPAGALAFAAIYRDAARVYAVSPFLLASVHAGESDFSRSRLAGVHSGVNFAGCCAGPMQFSIAGGATPAQGGTGGTWAAYRLAYRRARLPRPDSYPGRVARPHPNVYDSYDAIYAAAAYFHRLGAGPELDERALSALAAYGGTPPASLPYARVVLARARAYERDAALTPAAPARGSLGRLVRVAGSGPWLVAVGGERCDRRIVPDVLFLVRAYRLEITDCYSLDPIHKGHGEHPLALAIDAVPAANGSWDLVDALAHRVEPVQDQPIAPFRWVGYDGDANHGRGNHLHLSWLHAPAAFNTRAAWVEVFK